jgi:integrase
MRGDGRKFKRGTIFWCAYFIHGKEQRESCKTTDPKVAEKHLRACLKRAHASEVDPTRPFLTVRDRNRTVNDLLNGLKTDFELRGKASPQNLSNITRVKADFGRMRALALTPEGLANYVRDRLTEGYAKASVNRWTQTLRQAYTLAELPAPKIVHLDESDNVRRGFFSEPEIRRVMAALPANLADFVLFGWLTAMRKGEIASLRWEDVDGDTLALRGEHSKNGEARTVPLTGELADLIERRRALRNGPLVFHRKAQPVREFRKAWATACRLAGVPGRLFHDLRRSAVRDLVRSGVSQHVAMTISGHKSPSMFRRYDISSDADKRRAFEQVEEYRKTTRENTLANPVVTVVN